MKEMEMLSKHLNPISKCEIKAAGDGRVFEGYASVWGSVDSYGDTVQRGAFEKTIADYKDQGRYPRMFYSHSQSAVIGKWTYMAEDEKGLAVRGELTPGHRMADDVYASLRHGAIDGLSIGFIDRDSEELETGGRLLKEIDLMEISVVSLPAEQLATITSVKSRLAQIGGLKDAERVLRDAGFTRAEAAGFISRVKDMWQSDSVADLEAKMEAADRIRGNTEAILKSLNVIKEFTS
jgi:HK97 family phage prohead protease